MDKKLGWEISDTSEKVEITRRTNETEIDLVLENNEISIQGRGDLEHHLIEDAMIVLNRLAELKNIGHEIK